MHFFPLVLFLWTLLNGTGKDPRNNKSIKSSLTTYSNAEVVQDKSRSSKT